MTFARNAAVNGDWMLTGPLDKPPLGIYAAALSMRLFAVELSEASVLDLDIYKGEFAARIPNVFASILNTALVYSLAAKLLRNRQAALFAGLLMAFSPYSIAFAVTAFADPLMLLFALLALFAVTRKQWIRSGLYFALSFASKPQAIFYLPLILVIGYSDKTKPRAIRHFLAVVCAGASVLLAWDTLRPGESVFLLGATNNMPDHILIVSGGELHSRLDLWLSYMQIIFGPNWILLILIISALSSFHNQRQSNNLNRILLLWITGYTLFHLIIKISIYDRYLLLLLPPLVFIFANCVSAAWHILKGAYRYGVIVPVLLILIGSAWSSSEGKSEIGGDHGNHQGIDQLADYLNQKPVATVIYDHWLGWELGYYMGQWSNKRRVYYPDPGIMVEDALTLKEQGARYFPMPEAIKADGWINEFKSAGFTVSVDYRLARFIVYKIVPP